ncbi:TonB-dependent receptor [Mucilaginibacter sp.]|uniref:TonB-dependent receptor n=1 Tax=Mucilaginibacter sp. TaxID=1882438 RepID=UPI0025DBDF7A|nr:TonB-dependent receptor [Mucilaginibacter sp.]
MFKSNHLITILLLLVPGLLLAQQKKVTISGTIKDKASGETLPGATVGFTQLPGIGVSANTYGYYAISVPEGQLTLVASYAGYKTDTIKVDATKNTVININLASGNSQLQEVVIKSSTNKNSNVLTAPAGVQRLSIESIKNVPVLAGEKDILKTIQLLPGVVSAGDGRAGFYVRGGGPDQNLILLDGATVYNASHLLGFFSVFNSDAIKDISIYKGGMPASYGGRLSSVEDITMNDGNNQRIGVNGGLGLIASRLTVDGPLFNKKGSFIVSARRTYADLFTNLASDTTIKGSKFYFYDFNAKANYQINDNNRIFLSGYFGKDVMNIKKVNGIDYANTTGTFRWNHIFSEKLFSNTSLIYSNYNYNTSYLNFANNVKVTSAITDYHFKQDFNYYINPSNKLDFGFESTYHITQPGSATADADSKYNNVVLGLKHSIESAAYLSNEWSPSAKWKITYGVRLSDLDVVGPGNFYTYDVAGNVLTTTNYGSLKSVKNYFNPEPRVAANYQLNDQTALKLSYDRTVQNIHLLSNTSATSPTSIYLPSTNIVKPEVGDQVALGYYHTFHQNDWEFSSEVYYRTLQNQIDYKDGANLIGNENVEADLLFGKGRAYGWENFLKKKTGKLTGWISYALSKSERQIAGINNGNWYNASQDQTHHLSIVSMYQASKKWTLSASFVYSTGNPITYPNGKFTVDGAPVYTYGDRNASRQPAYNRLDLGATLYTKKTSRLESSWNFSIYNVYGRANPYTIDFQRDPQNPDKSQVQLTTLFKFVPAVTYNFKF